MLTNLDSLDGFVDESLGSLSVYQSVSQAELFAVWHLPRGTKNSGWLRRVLREVRDWLS